MVCRGRARKFCSWGRPSGRRPTRWPRCQPGCKPSCGHDNSVGFRDRSGWTPDPAWQPWSSQLRRGRRRLLWAQSGLSAGLSYRSVWAGIWMRRSRAQARGLSCASLGGFPAFVHGQACGRVRGTGCCRLIGEGARLLLCALILGACPAGLVLQGHLKFCIAAM